MNLRETVFDRFWEEFGEGSQFLWEDAVRGDFEGGSVAPTEENKRKNFQRAAEISAREMIGGYVRGLFPEISESGGLHLGDTAYTSYLGTLGEDLIDVLCVPSESYSHNTLSAELAAASAAKAHALGLKRVEVCQLDRDRQEWFWFTVTGDFKGAHDYLSQRVESKSARSPKIQAVPNVGLTTKLDSYLWSLNKKKDHREQKVIHPSEISTSECDRKIAYGLIGEEGQEKVDPKLRRIFDTGHVYHDLIQRALSWSFSDFRAEVKVKNQDLRIHGHCDGVLNAEGLEIKTMGSNGFRKLTKAKTEHIEQATIYGAILNLEAVTYLYVNKNDSDIRSFRVGVDRSVWHKVATRAESIIQVVNRGDLPDPIDKPSTCKTCKYAWTCKPELSPPRMVFTR